ncbi:MORN repeat-containing protein 4 homolog [Rhodnius prolixus]|uniref:MORN repeat-containing protein 4 homolog n=1 Tax=Rhodnius prolixus TaxID=13249 RepID=UPI003D18EA37
MLTEREGAYTFPDGSKYLGQYNSNGRKDGIGRLCFPDQSRYTGTFKNNYCSGLGVLIFADGAKYEGEFMEGWFHGHGVFWRSDGMKFEGQFRGGRIWGFGLVTFADGSNGFPKHEGYFRDCQLLKRKNCLDIVQRAQKAAMMARVQFQEDNE